MSEKDEQLSVFVFISDDETVGFVDDHAALSVEWVTLSLSVFLIYSTNSTTSSVCIFQYLELSYHCALTYC